MLAERSPASARLRRLTRLMRVHGLRRTDVQTLPGFRRQHVAATLRPYRDPALAGRGIRAIRARDNRRADRLLA